MGTIPGRERSGINLALSVTVAAGERGWPLIPSDALTLIGFADDRRAIRSGAPCPVGSFGAGNRRSGVIRRFADDRRAIRPDAAGSVDPIGASGGVALCSKSESPGRSDYGE